ncbi:glycosyltransferase [Alistipes sp.]
MATKDRRIQYLGSIPHDEILQLQRTASLLVNPRTPEGIYTKYSFPSKTMEYLASGTPTLLYELPGIPKEYYHYCYSLNDQSITALAEKVDEVLSLSIEERTKLGEKAQQFILDTKNATIQCTKILELIKRT